MNSCFNTSWLNVNRFAIPNTLTGIPRIAFAGSLIFLCAVGASRGEGTASFRSQIAPILLENCVACHNAKKAEGGYRLDAFSEISKPGDSGTEPLKKTGDESGELIRRLTSTDEYERMPPESEPLSGDQIALIRSWVDAGGMFDGEDPAELLPFLIPPPTYPKPPKEYRSPVQVSALAFSPDGKQVYCGGYHELLVWDLEGTLVRRIDNLGQKIFDIEFSPDGRQIAVACGQPGKSGEVRILERDEGEVHAVLARSTDVIWDIAFRPNSNELAVACADKSIRVVNLDNLEETLVVQSHADWVTGVTWTPDGEHLVSSSRDKSAKVFDVDKEQLLISYKGHNSAVRGLSVSTDGTQVYSVGGDKKLHRWNLQTGKPIKTVSLGGDGFKTIQGPGWVLIPNSDKRLLRIDVTKDSVLTEFKGHTDWVLAATVSPDHSMIASGAHDGEIRLWNTSDAALLKSWIARP